MWAARSLVSSQHFMKICKRKQNVFELLTTVTHVWFCRIFQSDSMRLIVNYMMLLGILHLLMKKYERSRANNYRLTNLTFSNLVGDICYITKEKRLLPCDNFQKTGSNINLLTFKSWFLSFKNSQWKIFVFTTVDFNFYKHSLLLDKTKKYLWSIWLFNLNINTKTKPLQKGNYCLNCPLSMFWLM